MKLTTRCGTAAVDGLQRGAAGQGRRGEAAAHHPAARGHHGRARRRGLPDRLGAAGQGGAPDRRGRAADPGRRWRDPHPVRDRSRSAGRRARADRGEAAAARSAAGRDEAQAVVRRITGELAGLAEAAAETPSGCWSTPAGRCAEPGPRPQAGARPVSRDPAAGRRRGRLRRAVNDLTELLAATRRIAAQTRQRLSGITPDGATRRVSLHDADARPIAKGRLGRPVEFGYKAQVVDNDDGVVLDHTVERGNPADAPAARPRGRAGHPRTGRPPRTVTADRGYGETAGRGRPARARCAHRGDPPQGQTRQGPPSPRTPPSVPPNRQVAHRQRRPGSAPSNAATGGTAPASTPPKEPGSGPDTGSWPTTWSRSAPSPAEDHPGGPPPAPEPRPAADLPGTRSAALGVFQVEVVPRVALRVRWSTSRRADRSRRGRRTRAGSGPDGRRGGSASRQRRARSGPATSA